MSDPISATISLTCSALELASSIADFLERRRQREQAASWRVAQEQAEAANVTTVGTPAEREEAKRRALEQEKARRGLRLDILTDKIFFVLAVLGQRLFYLDVVAVEHIPEVLTMINGLWPCEYWRQRFNNNLDDSLRYASVAAMFFCSEC